MTNVDRSELEQAETELQAAVRTRNLDELDRLLHEKVSFMGPDGTVIGKEEDLASHRSGVLRISSLEEVSRVVKLIGETGITLVVLDIEGVSQEQQIRARLAYTRTWQRGATGWQVIAAQGSPVPA